MTPWKQLVVAPVFVVLAACTPPAAPPLPAPQDDTCRAARHAGLIGQDSTALERVLLLGQVRVIRPDTAVTMDYRPERINFAIDANGTITRVTCG